MLSARRGTTPQKNKHRRRQQLYTNTLKQCAENVRPVWTSSAVTFGMGMMVGALLMFAAMRHPSAVGTTADTAHKSPLLQSLPTSLALQKQEEVLSRVAARKQNQDVLKAQEADDNQEQEKEKEKPDSFDRNDDKAKDDKKINPSLPPKKAVVCGRHKAVSCALCPQGNGATWCNGECSWCSETQQCQAKDDFCPVCQQEATVHDQQACQALPPGSGCRWCSTATQCLHQDTFCPKKKMNPSLPQRKSVVCGGHKAASCALCPQGHGATWCNGECSWCTERQQCQAKDDFCPVCQQEATVHDQQACQALPLASGCRWCPITTQCLHQDTFCPDKAVWKPPEEEPWFIPPDPIDMYKRTLSIVLPCGSENDFFERTIHSIYAATPPEILKDIIVIDDNSDPPLEPAFALNQTVRNVVTFMRSNVTLGLIDAKHQGAMLAQGDIIVFFDCHVKPALGYWEPFVREISENYRRVVVPSITALSVDTWEESMRPKNSLGGNSKCFTTMDSNFKWIANDQPWVPTMSGGLLAISKDWFFEIGGHDQDMKGWGGENIDLSFRIWRCGGEIIASPQSYVAHMWRNKKPNTKAKYKVPPLAVNFNRARAMKAHAPQMFAMKTVMYPPFEQWRVNGGSDLDITGILSPLEKLKCKDFNWYLDFFSYIYKDAGIIPKEVFQLTPDNGKTCLMLKNQQHWMGASPRDELVMGNCTNTPGLTATFGSQWWHVSNRKPVNDKNRGKDGGKCCSGLRVWNTDQCIDRDLKTYSCDLVNGGQPSKLWARKGLLKIGRQCLNAHPLSITNCRGGGTTKTWKKLNPFQPQEFTAMSQDLQAKW